MRTDDQWSEMARRGMTYKQLAAKLAELGVDDTAVNIRNKVARADSRPCSWCSASGRWGAGHQPSRVTSLP